MEWLSGWAFDACEILCGATRIVPSMTQPTNQPTDRPMSHEQYVVVSIGRHGIETPTKADTSGWSLRLASAASPNGSVKK